MLIKGLISHVLQREVIGLSYCSPVDPMFSSALVFHVFYRVKSHLVLLVDVSPVSLHTFCYH
jgi:hypothetical protein